MPKNIQSKGKDNKENDNEVETADAKSDLYAALQIKKNQDYIYIHWDFT